VGIDHAVDSVAAAATDSDDLDLGLIARVFVKLDADFIVILVAHVSSLGIGGAEGSVTLNGKNAEGKFSTGKGREIADLKKQIPRR
jgi:hypothetical protein